MPRILIVEDDQDFRGALETMIRFEGYEVSMAHNGDTGFAQAQIKKPDVIITDVDMPGMNGLDFVRKVREDAELSRAYCILITGKGGQDSKLAALRAGADDFLEKPSSRQEILGRLEIAQKVLAVQQLQREAEARAQSLADAPKKTLEALDPLEKAIAAAEVAISKKDAASLVGAIKAAKECAAKIRAACAGGAAPSEGSWL